MMERKKVIWWAVAGVFAAITLFYIYAFFTSGIAQVSVSVGPPPQVLIQSLAPATLLGLPVFLWGIIEIALGVLAYPLEMGKGTTSIYTTLASILFTLSIMNIVLGNIVVV